MPTRFNKSEFFLRSADTEGSGGRDGSNTEGGEKPDANKNDDNDNQNDDKNDIQKLIEKAVADAVAGLKKKNEEVIGTNKKLKDELSAVKSKPTLSDDEYAEFRSLKEKLERDEMLRLLADGKSEELIERVTKKTRLDAEAKLAAEVEARSTKEREATEWKSRYEQTLVHVEVAKTVATAVKPQYQDLVTKLVAERVKLVDGNVRVVNADGEIEMTANGLKPLAVSDYVETLRSSYSDLFVGSTGGGAGGSGKKSTGTSNRLSMDAVEGMSMEDYARLRTEGKI